MLQPGVDMTDCAQRRKSLRAIALLFAFVAGLGGCNSGAGDGVAVSAPDNRAQLAATKAADGSSGASGPNYVIGAADLLKINVFQAPDLSKTVLVAADGSINLPLIGTVPAAGRSASDLETEIQKRLATSYLRKPQVSVMVAEYNSARVTVEGAVKAPGVFPMRGKTSLIGAIALAGGLDNNMSSDSVTVLRSVDGARQRLAYNLSDIRGGRSSDPEIVPGDVVVVEDSTAKVGFSYFQRVAPVVGTGQAVQGVVR
jgi:polysaccharide export outer membrane protein